MNNNLEFTGADQEIAEAEALEEKKSAEDLVNCFDEVISEEDVEEEIAGETIEDDVVEPNDETPKTAELIPVGELSKIEVEFLKNTIAKYNIDVNSYSIVRLPVDNVIKKLYIKEDAGNGQFNLYEFEDSYIRSAGANGVMTTFNLYDIIQLDGMKCMIIGFEVNKDFICLSCLTKSIGFISIPLEIGNNIYIIDSNDEVRRNLNNKL